MRQRRSPAERRSWMGGWEHASEESRAAFRQSLSRYAEERLTARASGIVPEPEPAGPESLSPDPAPPVESGWQTALQARAAEIDTRIATVEDGLAQLIDRFTERGDWRPRVEQLETSVKKLEKEIDEWRRQGTEVPVEPPRVDRQAAERVASSLNKLVDGLRGGQHSPESTESQAASAGEECEREA